MNYVESLNLFGAEAKVIPCITGGGAPTDKTQGAVGCLYLDTYTGDIYKCVAASDDSYVWGFFPNVDDERVGINTWSSQKIYNEISKVISQVNTIIDATVE